MAAMARTNCGTFGGETASLHDTPGITARLRCDGHIDIEKETRHPDAFPAGEQTLWADGLPHNAWFGSNQLAFDLANGHMKQLLCIDETDRKSSVNLWKPAKFEGGGTRLGVNGSLREIGLEPDLPLTARDAPRNANWPSD